ncbi:response regulator [Lachnotalea glycerini]|uniref:Stage 0 sporulation protein A homolog n=2 Tax=Lachnotalea glycerini TaxID=1763509 RepID=A0A371JH54_9FIRM|nr:response regulator [Lachnotalea glycerini]
MTATHQLIDYHKRPIGLIICFKRQQAERNSMLKVLIADDEPVIINGLKNMIKWNELDCEIVGTAYDGMETLDCLRKENPDIAIFDICMPGLTGIELIKKINKENYKTKVIFISGYQDFFYAQEALKEGAVEYLLKPVKKANLEQAVKKAQMLIWQQNPVTLLQETKNEIREIFSDINKNNEYAEEELYNQFHALGLDFTDKLFVGVCFSISNEDKKQLTYHMYEKYELIRFSIFNRIQTYFTDNRNGFVIKRDDSSCNIMILLPKEKVEDMIAIYIEPVVEMILKDYQIHMFVAIGDKVTNITKLKYAYKTAKFAFELKYFENKNLIVYQNIKKEYECSFDDFQQVVDIIIKKIIAGDKNIEHDLLVCLDMIENLHYGNRYAAINRCFSFIVNFYQTLADYNLIDESYRDRQDDFMNTIRLLDTFEEVKNKFIEYYKEFTNSIFDEVGNKDKLIVARIKDYIQQNYVENITLSHMAKQFYMNSFYFSSFFKKETGKNFKAYLTDIRMKEALRLILSTDLKTYEIAEKVGYNNVRQFTDKFKELYDSSPSEYKKSKLNE